MQGTQPGMQLPAAPGTAQQVAATTRPSPSAPNAIRREQTSVPALCPAQPGGARASAPCNMDPGARSFVTHMNVTLNYCSWQRAARLGKFVPLVTFSEAVVSSSPFMGTLTCSALQIGLKTACILFAFKMS